MDSTVTSNNQRGEAWTPGFQICSAVFRGLAALPLTQIGPDRIDAAGTPDARNRHLRLRPVPSLLVVHQSLERQGFFSC
jgi:hypothetical protein